MTVSFRIPLEHVVKVVEDHSTLSKLCRNENCGARIKKHAPRYVVHVWNKNAEDWRSGGYHRVIVCEPCSQLYRIHTALTAKEETHA